MANLNCEEIKKELNFVLKDISYEKSTKILKDTENVIMDFLNEINYKNKLYFNSLNKETQTHSIKVAQLALLTGLALNLSSEELNDLVIGALIHDIGKILIPRNIIKKPGKLTIFEMETVKKHTIIGFELMKNIGLSEDIIVMALEHHERLDGSGYPSNKVNSEINDYAKIIAVCDVFEAFSSKRCYKSDVELNVVMDFLLEKMDVEFDSQIVNIFHRKVYPIILHDKNDKKTSLNVKRNLNKERGNVNERFENVYISQPGYQN